MVPRFILTCPGILSKIEKMGGFPNAVQEMPVLPLAASRAARSRKRDDGEPRAGRRRPG
jgi:hypothetical protein